MISSLQYNIKMYPLVKSMSYFNNAYEILFVEQRIVYTTYNISYIIYCLLYIYNILHSNTGGFSRRACYLKMCAGFNVNKPDYYLYYLTIN